MSKLRIGTRGSPLALFQAHETRDRLMAAHGLPMDAFDIVVIKTSGDRIQDRPLSEVGGKGLFTREIEDAMLAHEIDLAVHSSKDMPTVLPEGLVLDIFLPRADARDVLVGPKGETLKSLPQGSVIGTASLRRQALVRRLRPDLEILGNFRGNLETRLRKVHDGQVTATLLAAAGLKRLKLDHEATEYLDIAEFLPAVGQGAIAVECRAGDTRILDLLAPVNHAPTAIALACERAFLGVLDGSCRTPISGHAVVEGSTLWFRGLVASPDGAVVLEHDERADIADAVDLGRRVGANLLARSGKALVSGG